MAARKPVAMMKRGKIEFAPPPPVISNKTTLIDGEVFVIEGKKIQRGSLVTVVDHESTMGVIKSYRGAVTDMYTDQNGKTCIVIADSRKPFTRVTRPEFVKRRKYKPKEIKKHAIQRS